MGPDVKGNPLYISVYLLIASYVICLLYTSDAADE